MHILELYGFLSMLLLAYPNKIRKVNISAGGGRVVCLFRASQGTVWTRFSRMLRRCRNHIPHWNPYTREVDEDREGIKGLFTLEPTYFEFKFIDAKDYLNLRKWEERSRRAGQWRSGETLLELLGEYCEEERCQPLIT